MVGAAGLAPAVFTMKVLGLQPRPLATVVILPKMARSPGAAPGNASFGDSPAQAGALRMVEPGRVALPTSAMPSQRSTAELRPLEP